MSDIVARYFQKCDMCDREFQLKSKTAPLSKAILPGWFIPCDSGGPTPTLITVNICPTCLQEIAEYLRDEIPGVIDFSPMGCRTGFYLTVWGDVDEEYIASHLIPVFKKVIDWTGEIPAANEIQCGNYRDMDLEGAKKFAARWVKEIREKGWNCYKNLS